MLATSGGASAPPRVEFPEVAGLLGGKARGRFEQGECHMRSQIRNKLPRSRIATAAEDVTRVKMFSTRTSPWKTNTVSAGDVRHRQQSDRSLWRARRRARAIFNILTMPSLEDDKLPEAEGVIAFVGQVLVDNPAHEPGMEITTAEARRRQQRVSKQRAQVAAKPRAERHAEALLAAVEDLRRQHARRHFFEDVLLPA